MLRRREQPLATATATVAPTAILRVLGMSGDEDSGGVRRARPLVQVAVLSPAPMASTRLPLPGKDGLLCRSIPPTACAASTATSTTPLPPLLLLLPRARATILWIGSTSAGCEEI